MGVGTGGGATAIDRGVGGATGLPIGRSRNTMPLSAVGRVKEAEGKPLVDTAALKAMLRLLRLAQVCVVFLCPLSSLLPKSSFSVDSVEHCRDSTRLRLRIFFLLSFDLFLVIESLFLFLDM